MRIASFIILLLISTLCLAQSSQWAFRLDEDLAGTQGQFSNDITTDDQGNAYIVGYFLGQVDFDPGVGTAIFDAGGQPTGYLASYDADGNHRFSIAFNTSSQAAVNNVAVDAQGNVFVAGSYNQTLQASVDGLNLGTEAQALFAAKYNVAMGSFDWAQSFDASGVANIGGIDTDGTDCYMTGGFTGDLTIFENTYSSLATDMYFMVLSGNDGSLKREERIYGGNDDQVALDIAVSTTGDYFVAGYFKTVLNFDQTPLTGGNENGFLVHFGPDGSFQENVAINGNDIQYGTSLAIDSEGNVLLGGEYKAVADFGGILLSQVGSDFDLFVAKYSSSLEIIWAKAFGSVNRDFARGIAADAANNVYFSGDFEATIDLDPGVGTSNFTAFKKDIFVTILDTNGDFKLGYQVGGGDSETSAAGLALGSQDAVLIHGQFNTSAVDFDPSEAELLLSPQGDFDVFIQNVQPLDLVAPVVTVNSLVTSNSTPALTGTIDDAAASIVVSVDGIDYEAENAGAVWAVTVENGLADGTYDISVAATDTVGNEGTDATQDELTIDTTAPAVAVDALTTNDNTPTLTGTIDDASASIIVTVDGMDYEAENAGAVWTVTIENALADGIYGASVAATDGVGNEGTDATQDELAIDTAAPTVTIDALTANDNTPTLTGTINDASASIIVTVDGVDYEAENAGAVWTVTVGVLADGTYDVAVTATDAVGNEGNDATQDELAIDTTAPAVAVDALTTNDNTPTLTGTIDDASASIIVTVDGIDYEATNNGASWTVTVENALADGTYDISVAATDALGNEGVDATQDELAIDTTAPAVAVDALTTNDNTPTLTGTINDASASIIVTVDGVDYEAANNGATWTVTVENALAHGTYDVSVSATDAVGNEGTDATQDELTIDTTAPAVAVDALTTNDNTPTLTGTIDDATASIIVTVDGVDYEATNNGATWTVTVENATADGTYDVAVAGTDAVGNEGTDATQDELTIDTAAPAVAVDALTTNDNTPTLTGTIDDAAASILVTVDGVDYEATNNGATWTVTVENALADGTYDVSVAGTDAVGNEGTDATQEELTIDTAAPAVAVDALTTNDNTPTLTGTIDDAAASILVTVDGVEYEATNNGATWTLTVENVLADGTYDVSVAATDAVGNEGTDATQDELMIDATAPVVTIDPLNSSDNTPQLTGTVDEGNSSVLVTVSGQEYAAVVDGSIWTALVSQPLEDGTYNVVVEATDAFGNMGIDNSTNELVLAGANSIPTVTIESLETFNFTPGLTGEIDDPAATISILIDGKSYDAINNGDGSWTLPEDVIDPLEVGAYDVNVSATNLSDLVGTDNTGDEVNILPSTAVLNEATEVTLSSFNISWQQVEGGVDRYTLQVSDDSDFSDIVATYQSLANDNPAQTVEGLNYGTTYFTRIRVSFNSGVVSDYSNTVSARTLLDGDTKLDSTALVAIYDETNGDSWTNNTNWKRGRLETWFGVTVENGRVIALDLASNDLTGAILEIVGGLGALKDLDLSNNNLTDFGNINQLASLETIDVSGNRLAFGALQNLQNTGAEVIYENPGELLESVTVLREQGSPYEMDRLVTGVGNTYQWYKDSTMIAHFNGRFTIDVDSFDQEGTYYAEVRNADFPDLVLVTAPIVLKVSSLERDRESLRALYHATNGPEWTNNANWDDNPNVVTWEGVIVGENRVIGLRLPGNNLQGGIPDELLDIVNLEFLDLSGNAISRIPDLRSLSKLTAPDVSSNLLDFGDLELNLEIPSIYYANQKIDGEPLETKLARGTDFTLSANVGGTANSYQWYYKGANNEGPIDGAKSATYEINEIDYDNMGEYWVEVTNPLVPGLRLTTVPQKVLATTEMVFSPTYRDATGSTVSLGEGEGYLLKVKQGAAYDTLDTQEVTAAGLLFEDVVLGDYVVAVRTDTLLIRGSGGMIDSVRLLPTYFQNALFWEEATVLEVRDAVEEELKMERRPVNVEVGQNQVLLMVESDFADLSGEEGKMLTRRKVKRAGCSLRRRRRATGGRGFNEQDEYELIAYRETDDNGQVTFGELPDGYYRLNIEYPGIPMDPNSFIEFEIGEGGLEENTLTLEATVDEVGISVELVEVLSSPRDFTVDMEIYPNPVASELFIKYSSGSAAHMTLRLVDMRGKTVLHKALQPSSNGAISLDVRALNPGMYFLSFIDHQKGTLIASHKIIVSRH